MITLMLTVATLTTAAPDAKAGADRVDVRVQSISENRFKDLAAKPDKDASGFKTFSTWGQDQNTLTITLELRGRTVAAATHYGKLTVKNSKFADGTAMAFAKDFKVGLDDPRTEFVQIDREMMNFERPDASADQIIVDMKFELPPRGATRIEKLSGAIELRTGEPRELAVDKILSKVGQTLDDPTLKAAGITISVADPDQKQPGFFMSGTKGRSVTLNISGNIEALLDVDLVDARGEPLYASTMTSTGTGSGTSVYVLEDDEDLAPTMRLKLNVAINQKSVPVTFDVQGIALP